ncbi:hypothetical protein PFISCL1PPCAC_25027, partial [Pristionchus fissidentatus]
DHDSSGAGGVGGVARNIVLEQSAFAPIIRFVRVTEASSQSIVVRAHFAAVVLVVEVATEFSLSERIHIRMFIDYFEAFVADVISLHSRGRCHWLRCCSEYRSC